MANPYYVEPLGGLDIGAKVAGVIEAGKKHQRMKAMQEEAPDIIKSGDPTAIAQYMVKYPEMSQTFGKALSTKFDMESNALLKQAQDVLISGEGDQAQAEKVLSILDPAGTLARRKALSPDGAVGTTADIQSFEYLTSDLSAEEKANAKRVKLGLSPRATESAVVAGEKAFVKEAKKLEARLGLEPQVAGAVAAAKNEAKVESDEIVKKQSNKTAFDVYNNSMANLAKAMQGTTTGPFVGFIPAVTSNAQIAEGAVAVMAPVLKQMFRASGEGVFTDKDQELLMKMVPTRKDTPEARLAKIQGIDSVVRAKLGMFDTGQQPTQLGGTVPGATQPTQLGTAPVAQMSDEELAAQIQALQGGQ